MLIFYVLFHYLLFYQIFKYKLLIKCEICPSENFNYNNDPWLDGPNDYTQKLEGYVFKKVLKRKYYDAWRGYIWEKDDFCNVPYDINSINSMTQLTKIEYETLNIFNNESITSTSPYVIIKNDQSSLTNFYKYACKTVKNETDNTHQILFTMDEYIEKTNQYYYFNFTVLNPSSENVDFKFKTHTLNNIVETTTITECEEEEIIHEDSSSSSTTIEYIEKCIDKVIYNTKSGDLYMYLTENLRIYPHSMSNVQIPIKFLTQKNDTQDNKNFFTKITSKYIENTHASNIYNFFYNKYVKTELFTLYKTFTQLEIILEADYPLYVSSYSMTYKSNSYIKKYNGGADTDCSKGQVCLEKYGCINNRCEKCIPHCEKCSSRTTCDKCVLTAKNWDGSENNCNIFNFIDLTQFSINKNDVIDNVPPSFNYRITMEFWIYIQLPGLMEDFVNIIYKDFMAITIKKIDETETNENNFKVYCIPLEFLYNYPENVTYFEENPDFDNFLDEKL